MSYMEKRQKVIISFIIMVFLIFGFYYFSDWFSKTTGYLVSGEDEETTLAKCISEKNTTLYTAKYCPDCRKQKELFGEGLKYINNIECLGGIKRCYELKMVPAWDINGRLYYGLKSLSDLKIITNCFK